MPPQLEKVRTAIPDEDELEISLFGPGVGECIVLHLGEGQWVIIDSCIDPKTKNPVALDYLEGLGVNVEEQVLGVLTTHWHSDHTGGLPTLIERCRSANFWFSAALTNIEAQTLATLFHSKSMQSTSAGKKYIKAFADSLVMLREGENISRAEPISSRCVLSQRSAEKSNHQLVALSPTPASINYATTDLVSRSKDLKLVRGFASKLNENHNSVVLHLTFGDITAILGADLESGGNNQNAGWAGVVTQGISGQLGLGPGVIFKIPHHGSVTGHHQDVWDQLLQSNPISLVTRNNTKNLPLPRDIKRIKSLSQMLVSTTDAKGPKFKRTRADAREIAQVAKTREVVGGRVGHIQLRGKNTSSISVAGNAVAKRH